ncbi:MAG TPA: hypothetical protein V6D33_12235 [Cyanophyceae cyanobacterium]
MAERDAILNLRGKDDGFQQILDSATSGFENLSGTIQDGTQNLASFKDESGLFERSFKTLTGTIGKAKGTFDATGDAIDGITGGFEASSKITAVTGNGFIKLAGSALGLGKQIGFVNGFLGPMGDLFNDVSEANGGAAKGFTILNTVSKPLIGSLKSAANFSSLLSDRFDGLGESGKVVSDILTGVTKSLSGMVTGVKIADFAGDVYRLFDKIKDFAKDGLPDLIEQAKTAADLFEKTGLKAKLFGSTMATLNTTAMLLSVTTKGWTKQVADLFLKFNELSGFVDLFKSLYTVTQDAYLRLNNVNDAFETFQGLGIDTTMADIVVQTGLLGEGLIGNAEAAKRFAQTAISAFAQVEDKLAYLQTLSLAAGEGTKKLFDSFQSLAAGPLKNTVTSADAASASYYAMSAGADSLAQSNLLLTATSKGAYAGQVDQAQALNAVANAMAPYKDNFRDADKVMGQFFSTLEYGQLEMGNLTGAIGELASAGQLVGATREQILGMYAALTKVGPPGEAATRLSNLLQGITSMSGEAQGELDKLGVKLDKYAIQQRGLLPILEEIYTKAGGSADRLRKIFTNDYSFQAFTALVGNLKDAKEITDKVAASGSETLDNMFNKRRESLMAQANALMNGFKNIMADLGQRVLPLLEPGIKILNGILERFQEMPEWQKNFLASIAIGTIALKKGSEVLGAYTGTLMGLVKMYLTARVTSLFWSGQLLNEGKILLDMVKNQKDYAGALLRLFGIQKGGADIVTTLAAAQKQAAMAINLGAQATKLDIEANKAATIASQAREKATKAQAIATRLNAEADLAAEAAQRIRLEAEAQGWQNAQLNADADEAAAVAAKSRALADEATAKAVTASSAADLKSVQATQAAQKAKDAAHNADLAQKNASIRASQAAVAAELEAAKLKQIAAAKRIASTKATEAAVAAQALADEKAAIATQAKAAADQAGGTNALLNSKAQYAKVEAQKAQEIATVSATKASEAATIASTAEARADKMSAAALQAKSQAEVEAAFATKQHTQAQVENNAVSLADDDIAQTIDAATGAVEANSGATQKNTQAKAANAAVNWVDDDAVQTIEVVNGVVVQNTANLGANAAAQGVNSAAQGVNSAATAVNAGEKTAHAGATTIDSGAIAGNSASLKANTGAAYLNLTARDLLGKANAFFTTQITWQNLGILKNTALMKGQVGILGALKVAGNLFSGVLSAITGFLKGLLPLIGPVVVGITLVATAFLTFFDLAQAVGLLPTKFSKAAKEITQINADFKEFRAEIGKTKEEIEKPPEGNWLSDFTKFIGLARDETTEYTGFLNTKLLPFVNLAANLVTSPFRFTKWLGLKAVGEEAKAATNSIDEFFKNVKDEYEALRTLKLREELQKTFDINDELLGQSLAIRRQLKTGSELVSEEAKRNLEQAKIKAKGALAIPGEEFKKILETEEKAITQQTELIDKRIEGMSKMLEDKRIPESQKEFIRRQIKELKDYATKLDEDRKAERQRLENAQQIASLIDENNATLSTSTTMENLKRQQGELTQGVSGPLKDAYDSTFSSISKGMENTGATQRRLNNQMIANMKNFLDNVKNSQKVTSLEALGSMQTDAEKARESVMAALDAGAISSDLAKQLIQEIKSQEIELDIPALGMKGKGSILSPEMQQALFQDQNKINQTISDRQIESIQGTIGKIDELESTGVDTSGQAQQKRLQQEIKINDIRLKNAKEYEAAIAKEAGNNSPAHIKAIQDRQKIELELSKQHYDLLTKQEDYASERRIKGYESTINKIKGLEATNRLTSGQAQVQTLKQEAQIADERIRVLRGRLAKMKDTTSDAYKDMQSELESLETESQTKRFQAQRAQEDYALDRRVKVHEEAIAKLGFQEQTLVKTQGEAGIATLRQEREIAKERLALARTRLAQIQKNSGVESDVYRDQAREVRALEREIELKAFQEQRQQEDYQLERRVKKREDAIAQIALAEKTLTKTQFEASQETLRQEIAINDQRLELERKRLAEISARAGVGSDSYEDQRLKVRALQREQLEKSFLLKQGAALHELEVNQARVTNQIEAQNLGYKVQVNAVELITQQMQQQQELAESRNSLLQTATQGIEAQMQNVAKISSDERLNAQLQVTSAEARLRSLEQSQKFERESAVRSEQQKKIALDRQKIEMQMSLLQNKRSILMAEIEFRRLQVTKKITQEDRDAYQLSIQSLQQERDLLEGQSKNLDTQISQQSELTQNAREELDIRQQQARDGGVLDVMTAKQSEMTAFLDRQRASLEKMQEVSKARADAIATELSVLSEVTNSETKRRDISSAIAAIKLKSLEQQQMMESQVLEMNIRQKEAVLEQEKARVRMMQAENQARIGEAKGRVADAMADGATPQQLEARMEALRGYLEAGASMEALSQSLEQRGRYEKVMGQLDREQLAMQQQGTRQQAKLEFANTLPAGMQERLKRQIRNEIMGDLGLGYGDIRQTGQTMARGLLQQNVPPPQLAGSSQERIGNLFNFIQGTSVPVQQVVDYQAIRRNYLSQAQEFDVPNAKNAPRPVPVMQQSEKGQDKRWMEEVIGRLESAIGQASKPSVTQTNKIDIQLPPGTSESQAKSLENPIYKVMGDVWSDVRKELGY